MKILSGITNQPQQEATILIADGTKVTLRLEYRPQQRGWFYDLDWTTFSLYGQRLVASPNILRQYRKLIPFGLAVATAGQVEPIGLEDFNSGKITLYLLNADDVLAIEAYSFHGL